MHHRKDRTRTEDLERERRAARGGATATRQPADAGSLPAFTASLQNTAGNAAMSQVVDTARQGGASTVPGAIQRAVHPGASATVQRAEEKATGGHGGIKKRADGRILEKPTNDVERNFYSDMRAGKHPELNDVVPGSHTAGAVKEMDSETGGSDDTHIYIDNLTQGMNKPKLLDIKVGESTSSKQELLLTMKKADAAKKKAKLKVADVMTGSKLNDYRVVGGTDLGGSRLKNGMLSKRNIGKFSDDASVYDELLPQLAQVRQAAKSSGLAFIAASVLIAVDQEPADGSQAATAKLNLIDFAHTFDTNTMSKEQTEKYQKRFDTGMASLIKDVGAAAEKARKEGAE